MGQNRLRESVVEEPFGNSKSVSAPKPAKRILSIQAFRGIAAMLVVLLHLQHVEAKYFSTHTLDAFQYGWIGVDLFFVVSGVVISLVTVGKFQNQPQAVRFVYHRLARIFPTYWFYYFVVLAAYLYNPQWISAATGHHLDVLPSFFLIPCRSYVVGQAWTLSYELYFYVAFFLILLWVPERFVLGTLFCWGGVVAVVDCLHLVPYSAQTLWVMTDTFLYEFLAGCLLWHLFRRFHLPGHWGAGLILLACLWFGGFVVLTNVAHGGNSDWLKNSYWLRPLCSGITGMLFLLGAMNMERAGTLQVSKILSNLGDWSYSIYLSHEAVVELVGRVVNHFLHAFSYAMLLVEAIALTLVVTVGYCSYQWIERPILARLYRK